MLTVLAPPVDVACQCMVGESTVSGNVKSFFSPSTYMSRLRQKWSLGHWENYKSSLGPNKKIHTIDTLEPIYNNDRLTNTFVKSVLEL
jgi:hypothetical protein